MEYIILQIFISKFSPLAFTGNHTQLNEEIEKFESRAITITYGQYVTSCNIHT